MFLPHTAGWAIYAAISKPLAGFWPAVFKAIAPDREGERTWQAQSDARILSRRRVPPINDGFRVRVSGFGTNLRAEFVPGSDSG